MLDDNRLAEIREMADGLIEFLSGEFGHIDGERLVCEDVPALLDAIARLRTAEESLTVENARFARELEAAKGGIHSLLAMSDDSRVCAFCKRRNDDKCDCDTDAEWRGVTENGGQNERG